MTKFPGNTVDIELKNGAFIDGPEQSLYGLSSAHVDAFSQNINQFTFNMDPADCYANADYSSEGTAYQTVVCTQFQWAWLLFPAVIVLAAAVLLAATE